LDLSILRWADAQSAEDETAQYANFLDNINRFNVDTFAEAVVKRVRDFEYTARKYNKEQKDAVRRADAYKDRAQRLRSEAHTKIAVRDFKEGDMALFLPTRGQAKGAWAAFNIGCPHYFLAEREGMRLGSRDFIVARISKVEQKVVDLSKTLPQHSADGRSIDERSEAPSFDDDNPFELSDGLTWWMVHATEERVPGAAPTTPGLGKSTVAAANVDARGSIKLKRASKGDDASKHLNKSLDSRRSSSTSKKGVLAVLGAAGGSANLNPEATSARPRSDSQSSMRPPAPPSGPTPASGLGIVTAVDGTEDAEEPRKPLPLPIPSSHRRPSSQDPFTIDSAASSMPISPGSNGNGKQALRPPQQQRASSPSKSIRSLQRHLDRAEPQQQQQQQHQNASPVARKGSSSVLASQISPTKQAANFSNANMKQPGWENLWSADYSLESPGKKK
jgi:autophagy-related protein 11